MIFERTPLTNRGKWIVRSIPIVFAALGIWVALKLAFEGRYSNASGGIIFAAIMVFLLTLMFFKPKENKIPDTEPNISQGKPTSYEGDEFALLYSSKDIIRVSQIEEALLERGIDLNIQGYTAQFVELKSTTSCQDDQFIPP